jgi:glycosyltransferase involved in cell wall biosynthesis
VKILIDAFRIVYDRLGDPLKLFIVGEGRERAALEQRVSSIRLRDVVVFVGRAGDEDLPRWYQAADAAVIPTIAYEGFGVSIIEAMSCGVPVIGTPVGAIPEVLRGFDERLLTDSAKPIAIADRLVWFAEEGMREHWHERTREYVKRYHSWSAHAQKVEEMLEDILERKDKQTERQAGKDKIMV